MAAWGHVDMGENLKQLLCESQQALRRWQRGIVAGCEGPLGLQ